MSAAPLLLGRGGPADALLRRTRLTADRAGQVLRGAMLLALATWLPLLVLSLAGGSAYGTQVAVPFLEDLTVHTRMLLVVPLLLLADIVVGPRLARVAARLADDCVVPGGEGFDAAIEQAVRWRDSRTAESIMLVLALVLSFNAIWVQASGIGTAWHARPSAHGPGLTAAGWWYVAFSMPVFQFLLFRWLWRGFIWTRFLARVARLELRLVASHPDRAGGLGFVGEGQTSFAIVVLAVSSVLSAVLADRVLHAGARVTDFTAVLAAFVVLALALTLGPLLVFFPPLARLARERRADYGRLAAAHHRAFEARWLGRDAARDALLGSADVSSMADLNAVFVGVRQLRTVPLDQMDVVQIAVAAALPMLPLVALEIPLREVALRLLRILL